MSSLTWLEIFSKVEVVLPGIQSQIICICKSKLEVVPEISKFLEHSKNWSVN